MRISVNVPSTIAAVLFFLAWMGAENIVHVNVVAYLSAGLFFFALTGLVVFNRNDRAGNP